MKKLLYLFSLILLTTAAQSQGIVRTTAGGSAVDTTPIHAQLVQHLAAIASNTTSIGTKIGSQVGTISPLNDTVVVFGDSYSNPGAFSATPQGAYPYIVANLLGATLKNIGVNGQKMQSTTGGDNSAITNINTIPRYVAGKYRDLVIELGLNDALHQDVDDSAGYRRDYNRVLDTCVARGWPMSKIVMCGIPYQTASQKANTVVIAGMMDNYTAIVQNIATQRGAIFYDAKAWQSNHGAAGLLWPVDSIHLNPNGQMQFGLGIINAVSTTNPGTLPVQNKGQALAVNSTFEPGDIVYHTQNILKYPYFSIGMDSAEHVGVIPDGAYLNTPTPQGGWFRITGQMEIGGYARTTEPEALLVGGATGVRAPYFRTTNLSFGSTGLFAHDITGELPAGYIGMYDNATLSISNMDKSKALLSQGGNMFINQYGGKIALGVTAFPADGVTYYAGGTFEAKAINVTPQTLTDATSVFWAPNNGGMATVTLAGNRTLNISGGIAGGSYTLRIIQDATGSRTMALPSNCKVPGGGGTLNLSTTANAVDQFRVDYDGTNYYISSLGKAYN